MKSVVFFVLCVAIAFSTEDIFAEIRKTDFGATLTQTIELQLKTSDNIASVIKMVERVKKGLRAERDGASAAEISTPPCLFSSRVMGRGALSKT